MRELRDDQACLAVVDPRGWYSRGFLPHFDGGPIPQSVTFRLVDSFPSSRLEEWAAELDMLSIKQAEAERRCRIEDYLDKGMGVAWLSRPAIAEIVEQALLFFDGHRYRLHAWVVMPSARASDSWRASSPVTNSALLEILYRKEGKRPTAKERHVLAG